MKSISHDKNDVPRSIRLSLAPILILAAAALVVGCYTVIRHPAALDEGKPIAERFDRNDDCTRCHADYAAYPYYDPGGYYPEYYFTSPKWGYYYGSPWWWHDPYLEVAEAEGFPESDSKAQRRREMGSDPGAVPRGYQPNYRGTSSSGVSGSAPGTPPSGSKGQVSSGTGAGESSGGTSGDKKDPAVVTNPGAGTSTTTVKAPGQKDVNTTDQPRTSEQEQSQDDGQGATKAPRRRGGDD